ncbi:MAG: dTMP kinase [Erysipelotrichaceae bacterium]|nr:dTMP kinase [Erysipelotrichaceae bacterium]
MEQKGIFITFEGPDGSGKTTVSTAVYQRLKNEGYDVIYTREPGGIDIAEQIRSVILDPKNTAMDSRTEALLYAASRRQHLVEKIIPALRENKIVICDRFVDSSLVYQGIARQIGVEEVYRINQFAISDYMPEMTVYLDISAEKGLARLQNREFKDRLDQEELSFHKMVEEGYHSIIARFPERFRLVDASQEKEQVIEDAYQIVKQQILSHE